MGSFLPALSRVEGKEMVRVWVEVLPFPLICLLPMFLGPWGVVEGKAKVVGRNVSPRIVVIIWLIFYITIRIG